MNQRDEGDAPWDPSENHRGGGADIKQLGRNGNTANQSGERHSGMNVHLDQHAVGQPRMRTSPRSLPVSLKFAYNSS